MISEEQLAELELMEAAYGADFKKLDHHHSFVRYCTKVRCGKDECLQAEVIISLGPEFPNTPIFCTVDGMLPAIVIHELNKLMHAKLSEEPHLGSMDVVQSVVDYLNEYDEAERRKKLVGSMISKPLDIKIARFLIYFHHIMSSTKRKAIVDNAQELQLGGISKTGFPGVVIIEGQLENVLEYVRRIQRLRWQQMVVRGEEIEVIEPAQCSISQSGVGRTQTSVWKSPTLQTTPANSPSNTASASVVNVEDVINRHRKIPTCFYELPTTNEGGGMSVVGAFCKECRIHDLFMTAMKKYDANS